MVCMIIANSTDLIWSSRALILIPINSVLMYIMIEYPVHQTQTAKDKKNGKYVRKKRSYKEVYLFFAICLSNACGISILGRS